MYTHVLAEPLFMCVGVMSIFPLSVGKTVMPCETYVIHSLRMLTEGLGSDVSMFLCVCLSCVTVSCMVAFMVAVSVYLKQLTAHLCTFW